MKNRSIVFKLFLLTSTLFTIIFLLFFLGQSLFLEKFYINKKIKTVQTAFEKFVDNYEKSDKSFEEIRKLKQEFHDKTNAEMQFLDSNGIIKSEFSLYSSHLGFEQTSLLIAQSIQAYNELRPHSSCDYLTPCQAHLQTKALAKRWKYYPKNNTKPQQLSSIEQNFADSKKEAGTAPSKEQDPASFLRQLEQTLPLQKITV